jgi:hypothetical protein
MQIGHKSLKLFELMLQFIHACFCDLGLLQMKRNECADETSCLIRPAYAIN